MSDDKKPPRKLVIKRNNIESAKILSETKNETSVQDEEIKNVDLLPDNQIEIKFEKKQEEILIDGKDNREIGTKTINFSDSNSINEFVEAPSKQNEEQAESTKSTITDNDSAAKIASFEEKMSMGADEFADLSSAGIDILETLISSLLRWYAKDTVDSPYTISDSKKNRLKTQLSMLMVKHKMKFKIEWVFIFTILVVFATPARNALEHRKATQQKFKIVKPRG